MDYYFPSDPDYSLWYTIRRAHEAIHKVRKSEIRPYKLSTVETGVLLIVHKAKNDITPAEISRQLLKDPHSISQLLGRMEKKGLLQNIRGYRKKNMVQVKLTEKGQKAFKLSESGNKVSDIMNVLSEREKKQLVKSLDKLRERAMEELR
jgi:DNA-binding MarR family transcriptional regulator